MPTPDLNLKDCETFLDLARLKSVREMARQRNLPPGQISKTIRRLEATLGTRLFERSIAGVTLTPEGLAALEPLRRIVSQGAELRRLSGNTDPARRTVLGVGGTSFIASHLLPTVIGRSLELGFRFRLVELPPRDLVPNGLRGAFDLCAHVGPAQWTGNWVTEPVGKLRWGLFARAANPLPADCTEAEARRLPYILPTYWTQEGFALGDDSCPLPLAERIHGDETATAEAGLGLLRNTDQVCFFPALLARDAVAAGTVKEIRVKGWGRVENEVYVTARADRVAQRVFKRFCVETGRYLKELRSR